VEALAQSILIPLSIQSARQRRPPTAVTSRVSQAGRVAFTGHRRDNPDAPIITRFRSLSIISPPSISILSPFSFSFPISFFPYLPVHLSVAGSLSQVGDNQSAWWENSIRKYKSCGNVPSPIGPLVPGCRGDTEPPRSPTSKRMLWGDTYISSNTSSEMTRLLRDGLLVLAGADHNLATNPFERALIQRLSHFAPGTDRVSRQSHNRHNVILDS